MNIFNSSTIDEKIEHLGDRIQNILGMDFEVTSLGNWERPLNNIVHIGDTSFMGKRINFERPWQPVATCRY